jgi:hypothetical protein
MWLSRWCVCSFIVGLAALTLAPIQASDNHPLAFSRRSCATGELTSRRCGTTYGKQAHWGVRPAPGVAPLSRKGRTPRTASSITSALRYRKEDSSVAGIAEIGMGCSFGVLWSESAIILTGCGPMNFSDALELLCYQGVIAVAGLAVFNRIVTQNKQDLANTVQNLYGNDGAGEPLLESTVIQVRIAEYLSVLSVLGAIVALIVQIASGSQMDGLTGINVEMCRALQQS